jgi:DNA-binding SARP family transcriptional activator/tetratricopeptide (TPR) repeat protein
MSGGGRALRFEALGEMRIVTPTHEVTSDILGGRRGRLVLATLILNRHRAVDRDELATLLWPEALPPTWDTALRGAISKVRAMVTTSGVEGLRLHSSHHAVQLIVPEDMVVDWDEAFDAVTSAERALVEHRPDVAANSATAAVEIAGRAFLPGISGEWVDEQRTRLVSLRIRALDVLGSALSATGAIGPAVAAAEEAISLDPIREHGHRNLMRVYANAGDRSAALQAYARCRSILVDELGVDPSPETERMHLELIGGPLQGTHGRLLSDAPPARPHQRFVGRDEELRSLRSWWQQIGSGHPRIIAVTGEAGIGKTRLLIEFAGELERDGAIVARGACEEGARIPFQPFLQAVSGVQHSAGSDEREDYLDELVARVVEIADRAPVLLVVDDLHWAGPTSVLALRHLIEGAANSRLGIAVTYRADEINTRHPVTNLLAQLTRDDSIQRIPLAGLNAAAVEQLLQGIGGSGLDDSARRLAATVRDATAGNSFFVGEALRHLAETDIVRVDEDGSLSVVRDQPSTVLAPTMLDTISARLAAFDESGIEALGVAAALGTEFDVLVVGDCVRGGLSAVVDVVDMAIAAGLVEQLRPDSSRCRFVHAVVRDAVYDGASGVRRIEWHRRIALAMEARYGDALLADLAFHFGRAAPLGEVANAVHYARSAAGRSMRLFAYEDAVAVLRQAIGFGIEPGERAELLLAIGEASSRANDDIAAHRAFLDAADLARQVGDIDTFALAVLGAVRGWRGGSQWMSEPDTLALLEEAVAMHADSETELRVRLLGELALWTSAVPRRHQLAQQAIDLAERLARSGSPSALIAGYGASRVALWHPLDVYDRIAYADRVLAGSTSADDPYLYVTVQLDRLADLMYLGDRDALEELLDDVRSRISGMRYRRVRWSTALWPFVFAAVEGRVDDAAHLIEEAIAVFEGVPDQDASFSHVMQRAYVEALKGDAHEAAEMAEIAVGVYPNVLGYRCALVWGQAWSGQLDDATRGLDEIAEHGFAGIPRDSGYTMVACLLAEVCVLIGDRDHARGLYEILLPSAGRFAFLPGPSLFFGPVSTYLAQLAHLMGDVGSARRHFAEARFAATAIGAQSWLERTVGSVRGGS